MRLSLFVSAVGFVLAGCSEPPPSDDGQTGGAAGAPMGGQSGAAGMSVTGGVGGTGTAGTGVTGGSGGTGATSGSAGSVSTGGAGAGGGGVSGAAGLGGSAGAPAGTGGGAGRPGGSGGMPSGGAGGAGGAGGKGGVAGAAGNGGAGAFDPCPPAGTVCRILPLGDSITDGLTVAGGYRIELFSLAREANKQITYVGGSQNGPTMVDGVTFPRAHEGHSGWTIAQIDGIVPTPALNVNPHIVLLHIGTNDMSSMASGAPNRLGTLIDQIVTTLPNALLVVSNIIPLPFAASAVMTYNAAVPGIVRMRADAGKHILFVDQFTGFPTSELQDNVHPNSAGYARMARAWYAAISPYLR